MVSKRQNFVSQFRGNTSGRVTSMRPRSRGVVRGKTGVSFHDPSHPPYFVILSLFVIRISSNRP